MEKKKMQKDISDTDIEKILSERLKEDPLYYLDFLKDIIDKSTPVVRIDHTTVFDRLKPEFNYRNPVASDKLDKVKPDDFDLMPTPRSVDQLFYPWIRVKLKEWQGQYFDKRLKDHVRDNGKNNIEKVFMALTYKGQGRPRGITLDIEKKINFDFANVQQKCDEISKTRRWQNNNSREDLIRSSFPDVGSEIVSKNTHITTADQLRNLVLSKRYGCSVRNIEDFVRRTYHIFKYFKEYPDAKSIDVDPQRTIITHKNGKKTIIDK
jgi:hypothetical protein